MADSFNLGKSIQAADLKNAADEFARYFVDAAKQELDTNIATKEQEVNISQQNVANAYATENQMADAIGLADEKVRHFTTTIQKLNDTLDKSGKQGIAEVSKEGEQEGYEKAAEDASEASQQIDKVTVSNEKATKSFNKNIISVTLYSLAIRQMKR